jgi:hypothetical protein
MPFPKSETVTGLWRQEIGDLCVVEDLIDEEGVGITLDGWVAIYVPTSDRPSYRVWERFVRENGEAVTVEGDMIGCCDTARAAVDVARDLLAEAGRALPSAA